jgi:hypothetical protein
MKTSLSCIVQRTGLDRRLFFCGLVTWLMLYSAYATALEINPSAHKALIGGSYAITNSTLDAGGGSGNGGSYRLESSIGQPDAGGLTSARYRVQGGFWVEQGSASVVLFSSGFE